MGFANEDASDRGDCLDQKSHFFSKTILIFIISFMDHHCCGAAVLYICEFVYFGEPKFNVFDGHLPSRTHDLLSVGKGASPKGEVRIYVNLVRGMLSLDNFDDNDTCLLSNILFATMDEKQRLR